MAMGDGIVNIPNVRRQPDPSGKNFMTTTRVEGVTATDITNHTVPATGNTGNTGNTAGCCVSLEEDLFSQLLISCSDVLCATLDDHTDGYDNYDNNQDHHDKARRNSTITSSTTATSSTPTHVDTNSVIQSSPRPTSLKQLRRYSKNADPELVNPTARATAIAAARAIVTGRKIKTRKTEQEQAERMYQRDQSELGTMAVQSSPYDNHYLEGDVMSCDSSISSIGRSVDTDYASFTGGNGAGGSPRARPMLDPPAHRYNLEQQLQQQRRPRVMVPPDDADMPAGCSLAQLQRMVASSSSQPDQTNDDNDNDNDNDDDDQASVVTTKSEKSARFNDALNTTREYSLPPNSRMEKVPTRQQQQQQQQPEDEDCQSEGGHVRGASSSTLRGLYHHQAAAAAAAAHTMHQGDGRLGIRLDQHRFDSRVLGTYAKDESTQPHVLNASLMDALQDYLPYTKRGELFWLQYSLVRDGSSMQSLLSKSSGGNSKKSSAASSQSNYTLLAIETMDGEVFGAFTARPWHVRSKYYGTPESFLWRLRDPRSKTKSRAERAWSESDVEVFSFAGHNDFVQLCQSNRLVVGGGTPSSDCDSIRSDRSIRQWHSKVRLDDWGFGLAFGSDLQQGSSSPCMTFDSPSLSKIREDGEVFEVANVELWALTPCSTVKDAERMVAGKAFVERCPTV